MFLMDCPRLPLKKDSGRFLMGLKWQLQEQSSLLMDRYVFDRYSCSIGSCNLVVKPSYHCRSQLYIYEMAIQLDKRYVLPKFTKRRYDIFLFSS